MALFGGSYPGNQYRLDLDTSVSGTTINAWSDVTQLGGSGWQSDAERCRIRISGVDTHGWWAYDYTVGADTKRAISASRNVGYGSFLVETWVNMYFASYGTLQAYEARWVTITNPATVPATPTIPSVSEITATGMKLSWALPANGGAALDQMLLRRFSTPDGSGPYVDYPNAGNATSRTVTDLTAGTPYWWAVYAHNSVGYSGRSPLLPTRTLARARVPKAGAYVPAAQVTVPTASALVAAAAVKVPKAGAYVDAV